MSSHRVALRSDEFAKLVRYCPSNPLEPELGSVRRQGFWDNWRRELTEALAHQGCHFKRPLPDEASGVV